MPVSLITLDTQAAFALEIDTQSIDDSQSAIALALGISSFRGSGAPVYAMAVMVDILGIHGGKRFKRMGF